jgi:DNA polymerase-3 subunit beta
MLKIKVEGKELKGIIEKALCNMDKKAALPILTKIVLSDDGNKLTAYTSDLEGYLQVNTNDYSSIEAGSIGIDEEDLKVLLKMNNEVTITELEDSILVQNGKKNISLIKYDISDFPKMPEGEFLNVLQFNENNFAESINNLVTFTSDNESNKIMRCIHFNITDSRIETLDGHRIGMKTINENEKIADEGKFLVTNKIFSDLKKTLDKKSSSKVVMSYSTKHILVKGANFTYIQRRVDGEYYKLDQMLTNDFKLSFKADTKEMLSHMKYYTDNVIEIINRKPVVLKISNDTVLTYARNSRFEVSDSMEIKEHSGEDISIGFNPYFLVDALKIADSDTVLIGGINSKAPFFINANEYSFVILPVNLDIEIEAMEKYLVKVVA